MVKLVAFFKRKKGLSVEEFGHHWRTTHADLVVRQDGLRRYAQNHTLDSAYRSREPVCDGVAEAWFDDTQAMRDLAPSAEFAAVQAEEANFIDPESMGVVLTNEVVITDGPTPRVKQIVFLNKREDVSVDHFQKHWRKVHGPIAAAIPGHRRYVQCHARLGIYASGRAPVYDGIPMSWFDDFDSLRASGKSAEYERTRADEPNFMISGRLPFVVVREIEIELPGRTRSGREGAG